MPVDHPSLARIFRNQTAWLLALAGEQQAIWQGGDISACVTPGHGHLLVPAGVHVSPDDLDAAFAWLGQSGISPLLIWSDRDDPALERNIRGRGGGDSWQPHWMERDLDLPVPDFPSPPGIGITRATLDDLPALESARDVPYLSVEESRIILDPSTTGSMQMFIARMDASGEVVGIIVLFTPQDGERQAGIYNAGVRFDLQRRGIGSALTAHACLAAYDAGYRAISLNATPPGERAYRKVGFEVIGDGRTWFMRFPVRKSDSTS